MARILKLSKKAARALVVNAANTDQSKDLKVAMKWRRLHRKFQESAKDYFKVCDDAERERGEAQLNLPTDSIELKEALRLSVREQEQAISTIKDEPAKDAHNDGILLENEEFNFLKGKLYEMKGIPSSGPAGEIWEEIFDAMEGAEEVKIKAVSSSEEATGG